MKKLTSIIVVMAFLMGTTGTVWTNENVLLGDIKKAEEDILALTTKYESALRDLQQRSNQPTVILAGFGCTPEPAKPEPKVETPKPTPPLLPEPRIEPKKSLIKKPMVKKSSVTKVTKDGNVWTLKLNTNKLKFGHEVHLCIGYLYFPVSADQIGKDGTVKVKVDWTPPGNPRVSAGIWNGDGAYITSMLVSGG